MKKSQRFLGGIASPDSGKDSLLGAGFVIKTAVTDPAIKTVLEFAAAKSRFEIKGTMALKIEYPFEQSNSAGRLWKILNDLRGRTGGELYTQLGQAMGIDPADPVAYIAALSALISVLDSVDRQVRAVPDVNHQLHLRALPHLRAVLGGARQNQNFDQFKAQLLSQDSLTPLTFCADLLGKTDPEDEILPDELKSLLEDISHLYESILTSTLPKAVRTLILDQLENIRRAVHEYRVRGVRALREALATAVGQVHMHAEDLKGAKSQENQSELRKFAKNPRHRGHAYFGRNEGPEVARTNTALPASSYGVN